MLTPVGIGLDLIDLKRFELLYGEEDKDLLARCFTKDELESAGDGVDRVARLAGRFAAKEAAYKAIGGASRIALTDIVVTSDSMGKPTLVLHGEAKAAADRVGITSFLCSYTHSDASVAAVVVALSAGPR